MSHKHRNEGSDMSEWKSTFFLTICLPPRRAKVQRFWGPSQSNHGWSPPTIDTSNPLFHLAISLIESNVKIIRVASCLGCGRQKKQWRGKKSSQIKKQSTGTNVWIIRRKEDKVWNGKNYWAIAHLGWTDFHSWKLRICKTLLSLSWSFTEILSSTGNSTKTWDYTELLLSLSWESSEFWQLTFYLTETVQCTT